MSPPKRTDDNENEICTHGTSRWFKPFNTATTCGLLHSQMSLPKGADENENEKYSRDITRGVSGCHPF
jgi:hypothetical protein